MIGGLSQAQVMAAIRPKGRHLLDTFATLSPRWQVVAGTLAVDTGALKAATLGDWGNNLVANGGMETGDPPGSWSYATAIADGVADERTGGSGAQSLSLVNDGANNARATQNLAMVVGSMAQLSAWVKTTSTRATVAFQGVALIDVGNLLPWTYGSGVALVTTATPAVLLRNYTATNNLAARYDDVAVYRQNAAAIAPFAPNFRARLVHVPPAAGVVTPAGWMFRYTDLLNYWELRILPNTAGNDFQIVQVTAGVSTVRAEADVDWTADQNDEVLLTVRGSNITTAHRKYGASVWTAGPSYASATQGISSPWAGPLQYDTARRWGEVEVWW